jgi:hypothetical protein
METLQQQTFLTLEDSSLSSVQGFHAKPRVLPGSDEAKKMTVGSGLQLSRLLNQSSPLGAFSKILMGSPHFTNSEEFCYVWKVWDTRLDCSAFQLTPLAQSTGDTECLLWRTPNAAIVTGGAQDGEKRLASGHALQLSDQAKTPKLWPTPTQRDWKSTSHGNQGNARPLSEVAGLTDSGSLNPRFVEELMGYEIDHTVLKPSETPSSRNKPTRSSRRSRKLKGENKL